MKVSELFSLLSYGVFSNIALSNDGNGTILDTKKPKILNYTNTALVRLYSRFNLRENDLLLRQSAEIRMYDLDSQYALTNLDAPPERTLYIQDSTTKPFTDDIVKVLVVVGLGGHSVGLNDPGDPSSVYTPSPLVLQVPAPVEGRLLGVVYQALHPVLVGYEDTILLPKTLHQALIHYIAYLNYSDMNGQEQGAKAQEHLALYDAVCGEVQQMDLVNSSQSQSNVRFEKGGWV